MTGVRLREATADDLPFLATMLGEAAVWRPEKRTPTGEEALADPRYEMYLAGWPRPGDLALIAEDAGDTVESNAGGEPLGAAWYRRYTPESHGYGFVAEDVPEVSIAVVAPRRGQGIGRRLLVGLIDASVAEGHAALSLSVNDENPARRLYESVGFEPVSHHGVSWTMVRRATPPSDESVAAGASERPTTQRARRSP
jgi:GNAT superfamily N-acetyltransferase